ncbi:hypothetical protein DPMN_187968 [Dreissena polymorpha]|uniref:Uncharacterized protein n=1 Tax=Dreissena polymorpha TaxID=45954 RepID=A0A9D4DQS6_DREPO|nr:hypothetical protein DPMN_187968 [Dreissena polymorpha]
MVPVSSMSDCDNCPSTINQSDCYNDNSTKHFRLLQWYKYEAFQTVTMVPVPSSSDCDNYTSK